MAPTSSSSSTPCLLLPALSLPLSRISLRAAYRPTFENLLPTLNALSDRHGISRLDVGVILSSSHPLSPPTARTKVFSDIQNLLAEVYVLLCIVAAQSDVELDYPGGINVRLFCLESRINELPGDVVGKQVLSGPLVDFQTFIASRSSSTTFYTVESETGLESWNEFKHTWQRMYKSSPKVHRLPCGPAISLSPNTTRTEADPDSSTEQNAVVHKSVAVGGTFDHIHIGHKLLLTATAFMACPDSTSTGQRKITIGITNDALLTKKKYSSVLESWEERQEKSAEFVESILIFHPDPASIRKVERIDEPGPNGKIVRVIYSVPTTSGERDEVVIDYVAISDPYGPTITDEDISALVISAETRAGGKAVNDKRVEKGWKGLEVFEVDVLDPHVGDDDEGSNEKAEQAGFASKISSTEIRRRLEERQKDRNGQ